MASSNFVGLKLHPERDADILAAIADAPDKSARLRELIREGLTVKRKTLNAPEIVKRKTIIEDESVLRKTPDSQVPPNGFEPKQIEEAAKTIAETPTVFVETAEALSRRLAAQHLDGADEITPKGNEVYDEAASRLKSRPTALTPAEIIRQRKAEAAAKLARPNPETDKK